MKTVTHIEVADCAEIEELRALALASVEHNLSVGKHEAAVLAQVFLTDTGIKIIAVLLPPATAEEIGRVLKEAEGAMEAFVPLAREAQRE